MRIPELGQKIREARTGKGMTQSELAAAAGLSRNTLNRLENGLFPDLGIRKASALLEELGMDLTVTAINQTKKMPDFVSMACTSAGISFKKQLTVDELVQVLLSGKVPADKHAHFIVLLEEAPVALLSGLIEQVGGWVKPGKVKKNLGKIAIQVGLAGGSGNWKKVA